MLMLQIFENSPIEQFILYFSLLYLTQSQLYIIYYKYIILKEVFKLKTNNKYTVITGASSGIGYAASKAFAKRGKNLVIVARNKKNLEKLKMEILNDNPTLNVIVKATDLSIIQNVYQLYEELKPYELETLINNAGFGNYDLVANQNLEKIETMIRLNIEALVILSLSLIHI
eukprot:TRINITY_DN34967_c0_g1_i1.p1 TRINITY_DN34967_c0_g1~~TRINITY_DN34967_c0_g1_i1.p1  ORF type:complete len:172 (-),score=16.60 TRINITY_DN34967_c0_g1_i1:108-623(-)